MVNIKNITSERDFESFDYYDYSFAKNINTDSKITFEEDPHSAHNQIYAGSSAAKAMQTAQKYINLVDCENQV